MKTYIIAEAGVNHNGSFNMAKELIDVALDSGADAVKFQTFEPKEVISSGTPKCDYQVAQTGSQESQLEMVEKLYLSFDEKAALFNYGREKGIEVLSTPFDTKSLDFLIDLKMPIIKIASGEITNAFLLLEASYKKLPIILSTGMATLADIEQALEVISFGYLKEKGDKPSKDAFRQAYCSRLGMQALKEKVTLLHCTTNYPAPFDQLNLRAIQTMKSSFNLNIGYSDHSKGSLASCLAVSLGAQMIEKHFTLDNNLEGPDHKASLNPIELKELVRDIRHTEEALGRSEKYPSTGEIATSKLVRRSIVAGCFIKKGEIFDEHNLKMKRPGTGLSPFHFWDLRGRESQLDYKEDDLIKI